jgi:hypothetical protein
MVDRRVTDSTRIGQLLASELTGLAVGVLADVSVVDADSDATPSESGTEAYRIAHEGNTVASVVLYPEHAAVRLHGERAWLGDDGASDRATVERTSRDSLRVESGAGVKGAVDALRAVLGGVDDQ